MTPFYGENDIIIDPFYENIDEFAVDFDYDLLGRPIKFETRFWNNHLHYVRTFGEAYRWPIVMLTFLLMLIVLVTSSVLKRCARIPRHFINSFYVKQDMKNELRIWEERKKFMQPQDYDRYAAVHCRSAMNTLEVANVWQPIPRTLPDYEAIRFLFSQPWLIEKTHKALKVQDVDPVLDQLVEGELEDALMLALKEKRMFKRKPLSLPARMEAKRMLARGEEKLPSGPILTPEMRLILGWEELYRQRLKEAIQENYRWWLAQDKTLPVEAREVRERLQPIVAQVRKKRTGASPAESEIVTDFQRLPHEEPAQRVNRRKLSSPQDKPEQDKPVIMTDEVQIISQPTDLDESQLLRELEEAEQAQVAKIKRATRRKAGRKEKKKSEENKGNKKDD